MFETQRIIDKKEIISQSDKTNNPGGYPYCYVLAKWNNQYVVWQMNLREGKFYDFHNGNYYGLDEFDKALQKYKNRVRINSENYPTFIEKGVMI